MSAKIIDCLRNRYLGHVSISAECAVVAEDCGTCRQTSCEVELKQAKEALLNLQRGEAVQEISEGDRRIRYFHSVESMKQLQSRVSKLEMQCGGSRSVTTAVCGPCGTEIVETFERVRPPPIQVNSRRWSR